MHPPTNIFKRNWRNAFILLAIFVDSIAVALSGVGGYFFRTAFPHLAPLNPVVFAYIVALVWFLLLCFSSVLGLYRAAYHASTRKQYALFIRAYLYTVPSVLSFFYIAQWEDFPRRFTFALFFFLPFLFLLGRWILNQFNAFMQERGFGIHNAVIVGYNGLADRILSRFETVPELGYRIRAVVSDGNSKHRSAQDENGTVKRYKLTELSKVFLDEKIEGIFVPSFDEVAELPSLIKACEKHKVKLKILSAESEDLLRFLYIHDIAGITLYAPPRRKTARIKSVAKRLFDICGSLMMLLVLSPVFLSAVIAIFMESGFPIFFRQKRALVKNGKRFDFFKFRSMRKGAEAEREELGKANKASAGLFFVENDPRVTKVGKILRRFSIDELPQLLNVLRGDMSLVGPRPLALADLDEISPENKMRGYYEKRGEAKPGMTGLWQISGRREVGFREMVLLDLYYIENQSIMFDLEILFATIPVVVFGKGAY
ncbi:MAG: sugar transferase [Bacteroidota bacterium]